ncbi:MAG: hypothetical protein U0X58_08625 [Flavobacteriaceae bacterium]
MKNLYWHIMVVAIGVAFYEQNSDEKNTIVMMIALGVFIFGLIKLSAKIPSKEQNKDDEQL